MPTFVHLNKLIMLKHCGSVQLLTTCCRRCCCCWQNLHHFLTATHAALFRSMFWFVAGSPIYSGDIQFKIWMNIPWKSFDVTPTHPMRMQVSRRADEKGHGRVSHVINARIRVRSVLRTDCVAVLLLWLPNRVRIEVVASLSAKRNVIQRTKKKIEMNCTENGHIFCWANVRHSSNSL